MTAAVETGFSPSAAVQALQSLDIGHPAVRKAFDDGKRILAPGPGRHIVMFCGAPGSGKSWLLTQLHAACMAACGDLLEQYPNAQPSRHIEASDAGGGGFCWEEVYDEVIGEQLARPRNDGRLRLPWETVDVDSQRQGSRVSKKKSAAIKKLKFDKTRQLLMDEVAHLLGEGTPRTLANSARALKSFSNQSVTKVALFCCYEGLDLIRVDTQLARRIQLVELRPYDIACAEDQRVFNGVVLTIGNVLGLEQGALLGRCEQFMERTNGGVGAVVDTFYMALKAMDESKPFDYRLLDRHMPSKDWAKRVRLEIAEGRRLLEDML